MNTSLFSIAYAPPIIYFHFLKKANSSKIEAFENYQKQSFRNRCIILSAQGKQSLQIPIQHKQSKLIRDIEISYSENWQTQHWKSLKTCYNSSPYFEHYDYLIQPILEKKEKYLFDYNLNLLELLIDFLALELPELTSEWIGNPIDIIDLRDQIHPKKKIEVELNYYPSSFDVSIENKEHLSIFDLLFNQGPDSIMFL